MFFVILGKNKDISLEELKLIQPQNIKKIDSCTVIFETFFPEKLKSLGGIIKRGKLINLNELEEILSQTKLLGINDKNLGIQLKKRHNIKRFKITDIFHTDKEVKEKGIELIKINSPTSTDKHSFGLVKGYQNISLYEAIDFDKPARDMKMGMMPAKLTHLMLNLGLTDIDDIVTIYDPFAGSGTTGFISNFFGYDFLGSDIKINYLIQNLEWRQSTKFCKDKKFQTFQHDIFNPLNIQENNLIIVSEGRLGPIVKDDTTTAQISKYQNQVIETYNALLKRTHETKAIKAVFTIPYYIGHQNTIEDKLLETSSKMGLKLKSIPEIYKREGQKVGRKIIIINHQTD